MHSSPVSHVEENLAKALKEAQLKIEELKSKNETEKQEQLKKQAAKSSAAATTKNLKANSVLNASESNEDLQELNQLIQQKNYFKQRCFMLEDEIRELKGERHEVLIESKTNASFVKNFANFKKNRSSSIVP